MSTPISYPRLRDCLADLRNSRDVADAQYESDVEGVFITRFFISCLARVGLYSIGSTSGARLGTWVSQVENEWTYHSPSNSVSMMKLRSMAIDRASRTFRVSFHLGGFTSVFLENQAILPPTTEAAKN